LRPERPSPRNQGSWREESELAGLIRPFPRHPPNRTSHPARLRDRFEPIQRGFWLTTIAGVEFAVAPAVVLPFPSWPESFLPQHQTVNRSLEIAQLCDALPVAMPLADTSEATMLPARTGRELLFPPVPSWPELFDPQQYTICVVVTPQAWPKPAEIDWNRTPPAIATGDDESVELPFPNFELLLPQQ
jgi:hypothetical protein